jgi:hypothetical protein
MSSIQYSPTSLTQFRTQKLETRAFWSEEGDYGILQIATTARTGEEINPSIRLELYFDNKIAFLDAVNVTSAIRAELLDRKSEAHS